MPSGGRRHHSGPQLAGTAGARYIAPGATAPPPRRTLGLVRRASRLRVVAEPPRRSAPHRAAGLDRRWGLAHPAPRTRDVDPPRLPPMTPEPKHPLTPPRTHSPPAPAKGQRKLLTRLADAATSLTPHSLLAMVNRVAIAGIFWLSARTKVEGWFTISDSAY